MKNTLKRIMLVVICALMVAMMAVPALADDETTTETSTTETSTMSEAEASAKETSAKAIGAAVAITVTATAGAIGMAFSIGKTVEGISRQPEAAGEMRSAMMLGLVFIETAIIYALIVAILLVFVL